MESMAWIVLKTSLPRVLAEQTSTPTKLTWYGRVVDAPCINNTTNPVYRCAAVGHNCCTLWSWQQRLAASAMQLTS